MTLRRGTTRRRVSPRLANLPSCRLAPPCVSWRPGKTPLRDFPATSLPIKSNASLQFMLYSPTGLPPNHCGTPVMDLSGQTVDITMFPGKNGCLAIPVDTIEHLLPELRKKVHTGEAPLFEVAEVTLPENTRCRRHSVHEPYSP